MSFMQPSIVQCDFHVGETKSGEGISVPAEVWGTLENFIVQERIARDAEIVVGKFWGRYSAPGYMDATEWHGPFETLAECEAELQEYYGDDESDDEGEQS
jgi:hypothetical protein